MTNAHATSGFLVNQRWIDISFCSMRTAKTAKYSRSSPLFPRPFILSMSRQPTPTYQYASLLCTTTPLCRWIRWRFCKQVSYSTACSDLVFLRAYSCGYVGQLLNTETIFSTDINFLSPWTESISRNYVSVSSDRLTLRTLWSRK